MIRRPPRSTLDRSSAASDVYKRQPLRKSPNVADSVGNNGGARVGAYRVDGRPLLGARLYPPATARPQRGAKRGDVLLRGGSVGMRGGPSRRRVCRAPPRFPLAGRSAVV